MLKNSSINKSGVSFIEILVILLIIGLITSFVIPSYLKKQAKSTKQQFYTEFETLIQQTLTNAIVTNKVHQIFFDIKEHKIIIKSYNQSKPEPDKHKKFSPASLDSFPTSTNISPDLVIRNFFINGRDEFESGINIDTVYFYIMPDGTSQSVIINIEDTQTTSQQNKFAIVINPFYCQIKEYDAFQKP